MCFKAVIAVFFLSVIFCQPLFAGRSAGTVEKVDRADIFVRYSDLSRPLAAGERLYINLPEGTIAVDVVFPMQTGAKCRIAADDMKKSGLVKKGQILTSEALPAVSTPVAEAAPAEKEVLTIKRRVFAKLPWRCFPVELKKGDEVEITAEGEWSNGVMECGPDGAPSTHAACLMYRLGYGEKKFCGANASFTAESSTDLGFAMNDEYVEDNYGSLAVTVVMTRKKETLPDSGKTTP